MFSPTEVVSKDGPTGWPFSAPNLAHVRRSATLYSISLIKFNLYAHVFKIPRIHTLADDSGTDPAGGFDAFAFIREAVGDDCLGAVFIGSDDLRGEDGGVIEFLVVSPIGTTV